ncbi:putative SWR1-complex protein 4/DNA methyltransferase 1-associated protein [Helianthus debilis subsp. tardiflorus]
MQHVRVVNGTPPTGDYSFAKYNKVNRERFDLRFVVIADRFPSSRLVEELKSCCYSVSRAILIARAPSPADISSHPLVKMGRKHALTMVLSQTKHQEPKDAEVLSEAKKINAFRMAAKAANDAELAVTSNTSPECMEKTTALVETASPSNMQVTSGAAPLTLMADNAAAAASHRELRMYSRAYALDKMVQVASSSAGLRTIKCVEQFLQELKVNLKPKVPTKAVCAEHLELRKEILTLLNLQKLRGIDQDPTFAPDSISFRATPAERIGKRDQKRKGCAITEPSTETEP